MASDLEISLRQSWSSKLGGQLDQLPIQNHSLLEHRELSLTTTTWLSLPVLQDTIQI